jgi:hypothetical protein
MFFLLLFCSDLHQITLKICEIQSFSLQKEVGKFPNIIILHKVSIYDKHLFDALIGRCFEDITCGKVQTVLVIPHTLAC